MPEPVKMAFERQVIVLPLSNILPIKRVPDTIKQAMRYKRIVASIAEVGIVEPLVVARREKHTGPYMLVDGNLRHAALSDLGNSEVPCLIADDDEAFTYNKRVNRLATIQEHYMIVKAIERGVSEEKLAKALNVDIKRIKTKRTLLDGVCPEVAEMLKDKSVDTAVFSLLRKMKPMRQIETVELMSAMNNFTARYAHALLAATRQVRRVKFKLHSKQAALEQIGTELGMFVRRTDNQHRVEKRFSELSEDEQEAVAAELLSRARAVIAEQKIIESEAQEVA